MDESLRELQRLAAMGDEEALAELDLRARRLGNVGSSFRAPRLVGELVNEYDDPALYSDQFDDPVDWWGGSAAGKRFVRARGHRRNRRRAKQALRRGGRGRPPG